MLTFLLIVFAGAAVVGAGALTDMLEQKGEKMEIIKDVAETKAPPTPSVSEKKSELKKRPPAKQLKKKTIVIRTEQSQQIVTDRVKGYLRNTGSLDDLITTDFYDREKVCNIAIYKYSTEFPGNELPIIQTNNFMVSNINAVHAEDMTLIKGDLGFSVFPFGEQPIVLAFGGVLIDELPYQQYNEMLLLYLDAMRLKRSFNKYNVVLFQEDRFWILGYPINFSYSKSAEIDNVITFSMHILVRKYRFPITILAEGVQQQIIIEAAPEVLKVINIPQNVSARLEIISA